MVRQRRTIPPALRGPLAAGAWCAIVAPFRLRLATRCSSAPVSQLTVEGAHSDADCCRAVALALASSEMMFSTAVNQVGEVG